MGGQVGGSGWGCQDGCGRRVKVFVLFKKKLGGGGSGDGLGVRVDGNRGEGVKVDVNEESKFF